MAKQDIVVGMGEVLWDLLPDGKKIGGAPANFAYHISQFGLPGCVVSAVGDDSLGHEILDNFSSRGLDGLITRQAYPTGTVQVEIDSCGVPRYDFPPNVAWDNIPYTDELNQLAKNTKAFCFGSLAQRNEVSRNTINRFLDSMPRTDGSLVVFDVNLRQDFFCKDILVESMKRSDVLKINDEELEILSGMFGLHSGDVQDICRRLLEDFGLTMLILTCGVNGSYVFSKNDVSFMPISKVDAVNTVGAGDSFTAAFVASILRGKTIPEAHAIAVRTSAYVCTQNGATPVLPKSLVEI